MIKCYLSLVLIVGIQQTCFSHSTNIQQQISALRNKMKKEIQQDYQQRSNAEEPQDYIDNYDLIITQPAETTTVKPILRVGYHRHHGHRVDLNKTTKTNDPEKAIVVDSSPKLVGELSPAVVLTTASNPINDTYEANVKLLEAKVQEAIKNLTNYVRGTDTKKTFQRAGDLVATMPEDPRKENLNLTNYVSQLDIERAEDLVATTYNPRKRKSKVFPVIPFYRRFNYLNDHERKKPQKWVHCLHLISPKLQGINEEGPKNITSHRGDVKRLIELLSVNLTKFTSEDMVAILTEISKIRIRMYQWHTEAITAVLNVIIKGPQHDFRRLKEGINVLLNNWHLDTSMMSIFLKETRIFRPPCIEISENIGFTKKPGAIITFPKPGKPKKKVHDPDKSCHSKETKNNNDQP